MDLSRPQKFDRKDCLNWKFIAMIILHFHLHPQFNMNYFMYISHQKFDTCRGQTLRCSCSSSWGHGKILSKRPIPERLYAIFDEVGRNSVTEYKSGTNWCNKCSDLADKEFAPHPMFTPREQKKSDIRK